MTASRRGSYFILLAAVLWSTGGLFIKNVTLDGFGVSLWRSTFAAITLYFFYRRSVSKQVLIAGRSLWFTSHTVIMAMTYAALLVLFVLATKLTTSANAIFLQYTAPIYVLFFEPIFSKTRLKRSDVIAVIITVAAMGLFFIGKFDTSSALGNILALTSGLCFAAYALFLKHDNTGESVRWQSVILGHCIIVVSMIGLWSVGMIHPIPHSTATNNVLIEIAELLFLGIFQIGLAYSLFTKGIHYVRALDALLLSMVEPVLNPIWVFIGIGETPSAWAITGGIIILAVAIIRTRYEGKKSGIIKVEVI